MPGQALHVFERDALLQQVRDGGDAEGMRRVEQGQAGVFQAALHHPANVIYVVTFPDSLSWLEQMGPKNGIVGKNARPPKYKV